MGQGVKSSVRIGAKPGFEIVVRSFNKNRHPCGRQADPHSFLPQGLLRERNGFAVRVGIPFGTPVSVHP